MCEKRECLQHTILFYVLHSKQNTDTLSENNSVCVNSKRYVLTVKRLRQLCNGQIISTLPSMVHKCACPVANRSVDHAYSADSEGRCLSEFNYQYSFIVSFFVVSTRSQ